MAIRRENLQCDIRNAKVKGTKRADKLAKKCGGANSLKNSHCSAVCVYHITLGSVQATADNLGG